jgi:hypothetical protein
MLGGRGVQRVVDQRRFARAGNAGDAGQQAAGDFQRDVLQVVAVGADDAQLFCPGSAVDAFWGPEIVLRPDR